MKKIKQIYQQFLDNNHLSFVVQFENGQPEIFATINTDNCVVKWMKPEYKEIKEISDFVNADLQNLFYEKGISVSIAQCVPVRVELDGEMVWVLRITGESTDSAEVYVDGLEVNLTKSKDKNLYELFESLDGEDENNFFL
jgi:hypothetical protein